MSEIFGHHFQKGTGVYGYAVGLADRHRQSCFGDSTNKYCGCPCVQPDFSGNEGSLLRQPSSFDTTELPSEN